MKLENEELLLSYIKNEEELIQIIIDSKNSFESWKQVVDMWKKVKKRNNDDSHSIFNVFYICFITRASTNLHIFFLFISSSFNVCCIELFINRKLPP